MSAVPLSERHNERRNKNYSNKDIDPSRTCLNYHLKQPTAASYEQEFYRIRDEYGLKGNLRLTGKKQSTILCEFIITSDKQFFDRLGEERTKQFFFDAYRFVTHKVGGEQFVVSAVVHMDEKTPHMHFCFVPITKDGRLSAKEVLGNKAAFSKWQDDFYDRMHGFYPELERGLPAAITGRKHIPPYLFRSAENVSKSYDAISKAISDVNIFNAGKKREEAICAIGRYLPDCYKLIEQSKSIDGYVSELEQKIREQERSIENANAYASAQRSRVRELSDQLWEHEQDLKKLQRERDKAQKIVDAIPADVRAEIEKSMKKKGAKRYDYER